MVEQGSSGSLQRPPGFIHRTFRLGTVPGAGNAAGPCPNRAHVLLEDNGNFYKQTRKQMNGTHAAYVQGRQRRQRSIV